MDNYPPVSLLDWQKHILVSFEHIKDSSGLSPRELKKKLETDFKDVTIADTLRALSALCKQGLVREADESGVFEYCGGLKT